MSFCTLQPTHVHLQTGKSGNTSRDFCTDRFGGFGRSPGTCDQKAFRSLGRSSDHLKLKMRQANPGNCIDGPFPFLPLHSPSWTSARWRRCSRVSRTMRRPSTSCRRCSGGTSWTCRSWPHSGADSLAIPIRTLQQPSSATMITQVMGHMCITKP